MSTVRFWSLTASQPACTAASISFLAMATSPLWLMPTSATTKQGNPSPTYRAPIRTARSITLLAGAAASPARPPAVDDEIGAGHEAGGVRTQKDDSALVLILVRHPPEGNQVGEPTHELGVVAVVDPGG